MTRLGDPGPVARALLPKSGTLTAERVWEKMRKVCGFSGGRDCGYDTSFNKLPCAFDACPLLKREKE